MTPYYDDWAADRVQRTEVARQMAMEWQTP